MNASFHRGLYNLCAKEIRKGNAPRRFDRAVAMQPLLDELTTYWGDGLDAMFSYIGHHDGWTKIQRHIQMELASRAVNKALSDEDRQFIANLLVNFSYFDDVQKMAKTIIAGTSVDTFESAAKFALEQIGVGSPDFELKNEAIEQKLLSRSDDAVFATKNHIDSVFGTIIDQFYELGRNPYDQEFVGQLRKTLNAKTDWEARRFALTETGIASEFAQFETYSRNGVSGKRWNISGVNTREDHAALSGTVIGISEMFNVGGSPASYPLDASLPSDELVNCHCWLSPEVSDDFRIDPSRIWEGA